jgi:hypothetical protein
VHTGLDPQKRPLVGASLDRLVERAARFSVESALEQLASVSRCSSAFISSALIFVGSSPAARPDA